MIPVKNIVFTLMLIVIFSVQAGPYNRNEARPVHKVEFGTLESVYNITQTEISQSHVNGWNTLLGAAIGGLIGNQFGGGSGKVVATAIGAMVGGTIAHRTQQQVQTTQYQLVELLVRTEEGQLLDIIQDFDPGMRFSRGDEVRVLYFDEGVRVDRVY